MFMVLSSWPKSLREFTRFIWWMQTERRVVANPQTKPVDLGCESAESWQLSSTSTIAIVIITQPVSWYSFYRPTKGRRLSRPKMMVMIKAYAIKRWFLFPPDLTHLFRTTWSGETWTPEIASFYFFGHSKMSMMMLLQLARSLQCFIFLYRQTHRKHSNCHLVTVEPPFVISEIS